MRRGVGPSRRRLDQQRLDSAHVLLNAAKKAANLKILSRWRCPVIAGPGHPGRRGIRVADMWRTTADGCSTDVQVFFCDV